MEMTEAATTPVVAASKAPTKITAKAKPPRIGPNNWPMVSSKSSAMPLRSRIRPIKVKKGMASKVSFCMMPKMRNGKACNKASGKTPSSTPIKPKNKPQAPKLKATGKPSNKKTMRPTNMMGAKLAMNNSMVFLSDSGLLLRFGFSQFTDFFCQQFFGRLFIFFQGGVVDQTLKKRKAFD